MLEEFECWQGCQDEPQVFPTNNQAIKSTKLIVSKPKINFEEPSPYLHTGQNIRGSLQYLTWIVQLIWLKVYIDAEEWIYDKCLL